MVRIGLSLHDFIIHVLICAGFFRADKFEGLLVRKDDSGCTLVTTEGSVVFVPLPPAGRGIKSITRKKSDSETGNSHSWSLACTFDCAGPGEQTIDVFYFASGFSGTVSYRYGENMAFF